MLTVLSVEICEQNKKFQTLYLAYISIFDLQIFKKKIKNTHWNKTFELKSSFN